MIDYPFFHGQEYSKMKHYMDRQVIPTQVRELMEYVEGITEESQIDYDIIRGLFASLKEKPIIESPPRPTTFKDRINDLFSIHE